MKSLLSIAAVALASLAATGAKAELVTYEFTAKTQVFANVGLLNSHMHYGDTFTGSFTIDHSVVGTASSGGTKYSGALVDWTYQLDADLLEGTGGNVFIENNDGAFLGTQDVVSVYGNNHTGSLSINGNDFGGVYHSQVALFVDYRFLGIADAIDGEEIPDFAALDLGDWDIAGTGEGGIALDIGGNKFGGSFTSITRSTGSVSTVPELDPASLGSAGALVASAGTALRSRRRRAA